jgi:ketosteroid isomerase-like protein
VNDDTLKRLREKHMPPSEDDGIAIAHRFFDALQRGDETALRSLTSSDAVLWQNYDSSEKAFESRIAGLKRLSVALPGFEYADRVYENTANGAILQHRICGTAADGTSISVPIMARLVIVNGKISRFEEYLDRGNLEPLHRSMRL